MSGAIPAGCATCWPGWAGLTALDDAACGSLRGGVSFLGRLVGDTVAAAEGQPFLDLVEQIRGCPRAPGRVPLRRGRSWIGLRNLGNGSWCRWRGPSASFSTSPISPTSTTMCIA